MKTESKKIKDTAFSGSLAGLLVLLLCCSVVLTPQPLTAKEPSSKLSPVLSSIVSDYQANPARYKSAQKGKTAGPVTLPQQQLQNRGALTIVIQLVNTSPAAQRALHEISGVERHGPPDANGYQHALATPTAIKKLGESPFVVRVGLGPIMTTGSGSLSAEALSEARENSNRANHIPETLIPARGTGSVYRGAGRVEADAAVSLDLQDIVIGMGNDVSTSGPTGMGIRVGVMSDGIFTTIEDVATVQNEAAGLGDWPRLPDDPMETRFAGRGFADPKPAPVGQFFYSGIDVSDDFVSGVGHRSFRIDVLTSPGAFTSGTDVVSKEAHAQAISAGLGGGTGSEGGGMIEIVHDVAPLADKYFANFITVPEFVRAKNWLATEAGSDVIVDDLSFETDEFGVITPRDGSTRLSYASDMIVRNGAMYYTSAGNSAQSSFSQVFSDVNGNGIHEFRPPNPLNPAVPIDETFEIDVFGGALIYLTWLETRFGAGDDIDILAIPVDTQGQNPIFTAETVQNGDDQPSETLFISAVGRFSLTVQRKDRDVQEARPFQLRFFGGYEFADFVPVGGGFSANSEPRLAANTGATNFATPNTIENFSQRGRTMDGRLKPDIVGHDAVETLTFVQEFFGTSAAAPHVAGVHALALDHQRNFLGNNPTALEVFDIVRIAAEQIPGFSRRDFTWGAGRLNAGNVLDVSTNYFVNRTVVYDLSDEATRNSFTSTQGDTFLSGIFTEPLFGNYSVTNIRNGVPVVYTEPSFAGVPADGIQMRGTDGNTFGQIITPLVDFTKDDDNVDPQTYLKMNRVYEIKVTVASDDAQVNNFTPFRIRGEGAEFNNVTELYVNPFQADTVTPDSDGTTYTTWFIPRNRPALGGMKVSFDIIGVDPVNPNTPFFPIGTTYRITRIEINERLPRMRPTGRF